jgi:phosphoribosylanthranilate isomerase
MAGLIKICGLKSAQDALAAAKGGADLLGFHFIPKNVRTLTADAAEEIVTEVKRASDEFAFAIPKFVGVFVDAGEKLLAETAPFLSHFQFHGRESPGRVREIGSEFGVQMINTIPALSDDDLPLADEYADAADMIVFDARPPRIGAPPQKTAIGAEWGFLKRYGAPPPFLIAGRLTPAIVADAVAAAREAPGFAGVDASSGVEIRPGEKDAAKVDAFIKAARKAM